MRERFDIGAGEPIPADRIEVVTVDTTMAISAPLQRADRSRVQLDGADKTEMNAGDVFVIETAGGGG